ncbi:thioesterase family protein, partial [Actinoplanes nipponensis]|uniref:thioesterase family protein n=1 Tax=Actinoplanes nipponensis TaxID=135950 RepID=UPI0031E7DCA8
TRETERAGAGRFRPTAATGGAWAVDEQHISPMTGLIVHAVEQFAAARGADGMVVARVSMDILGVLKLEEFEIRVETVRPGRTIELVEAVVIARGRPAVRARVWRLAEHDTAAVTGGQGPALPHPETATGWAMSDAWPGEFITTLDVRPIGTVGPGRTTAWVSTPLDLVAGEPVSNLARYLALVDTANGIAIRESPKEWLFPNLDLTIHLHRQPRGPWTGLDTTVVFGARGHGLTSTTLHDLDGPVGRAEQILTVRPAAR